MKLHYPGEIIVSDYGICKVIDVDDNNICTAETIITKEAFIEAFEKYIYNPTVITCNPLSDEETEKLIKTIQGARIVPDNLQGWRYEETPQQGEWNNHTVACLLAELFGDPCACNHCGIDEWLPKKCDFANKECPDVVGVACWEQFLKHRKGGAT